MGTNYYAKLNYCEHCQRYEEFHLGSSSSRWCFSLHVYPDDGINTLNDLMNHIGDNQIYNEYDEEISKAEFLNSVMERSWPERDLSKYGSFDKFLDMNEAKLGPNNLLRHKIDGRFCIGHGEGTWDYLIGEFS